MMPSNKTKCEMPELTEQCLSMGLFIYLKIVWCRMCDDLIASTLFSKAKL